MPQPAIVHSRCLSTTPLAVISEQARIRTRRPLACDADDKGYLIAPTFGYRVSFHNSCSCNEFVSLSNRHLIDRSYIGFEKEYFKNNVKKFKFKFDILRCGMKEVVNCYRGSKKRMYYSAYTDIMLGRQTPADSNIRMFVKPDKIEEGKIEDKAPRAIQYRHCRYNLQLATFLKPYEHAFYESPGRGPSGTRVVTKGMNAMQVADLLIEKSVHFNNPLYICADHSKFDSTINVEHLRAEHRFYNRQFASNHLRMLLKQQIYNKGYTRRGNKYTVKGTRMSGDYNTGLGNSLINRVVLESWVENVKHEILLDGDDSIIIIENVDLCKLDRNHFSRMGFETKLEYTNDIRQAEYCQKRLVMCDHPIMVRNPMRIFSHMGVCLKGYRGSAFKKWLNAVLECEAACNKNMPFAKIFEEMSVGKKLRDDEWYRKMEGMSLGSGDHCYRTEYYETWGITESTQVLMEDSLRSRLKHFSYFSSINKINKNNVEHAIATINFQKEETWNRNIALEPSSDQCWDPFSKAAMEYVANAIVVTRTAPTRVVSPPTTTTKEIKKEEKKSKQPIFIPNDDGYAKDKRRGVIHPGEGLRSVRVLTERIGKTVPPRSVIKTVRSLRIRFSYSKDNWYFKQLQRGDRDGWCLRRGENQWRKGFEHPVTKTLIHGTNNKIAVPKSTDKASTRVRLRQTRLDAVREFH